jgi:hypothetical protein
MTKSLRPQQHRRGGAVTGEVANPAVPSESHGLCRRVFGRDGETGGRQRLPQIGRNLRRRWRGEHHCHIIRLVHSRCDDGRPRKRELLDRPIEVAECGKSDTVGLDRWRPSRRYDGWRWTGIARGTSTTTHQETTNKGHGNREPPFARLPHAVQSSVRLASRLHVTDSPPVSPLSYPANITEPSRDAWRELSQLAKRAPRHSAALRRRARIRSGSIM